MKRRILLLLLVLISGSWLASAIPSAADNSRFQEANAAYSRNDFDAAIAAYETLVSEHGYSPGLLYNLANSYARTGRIGKAVLNYERALKLAPGDADIAGNLQLVRTANGLFTQDTSWPERFLQLLSMNQWIMLGELALVCLTAVLLLSLRISIPPRTLTAIAVCCTAVMLASVITTLELRRDWQASVVIGESHLAISPFEGAAPAGNIQEGRVVYPGKRHGGYVFIEDETGRKGWIAQSLIEPVIPPPGTGGT